MTSKAEWLADNPDEMRRFLKSLSEKEAKELDYDVDFWGRGNGQLYSFLKDSWKYIDPAPFVDGWHLEAISEHLEAVTCGEIRRLIINIPPRHSKSSLVSVAWPVWTWIQRPVHPLAGPHVQFLSSSYAQSLSTRDALKSRRVIQSSWFQSRWGNRFRLTSDQNAKTRYDNDKGGYRIATSVDGSTTGEGGSIILIDDPLNAGDAVSDATRLTMVEWWDQVMSTRLNDPKTGAFVIVMQRLHEEDLTGHVLANNHDDWEHLCLPARYEWERHCVTSIGWEDPRGVDDDGYPLIEIGDDGSRSPIDQDALRILDHEREGMILAPGRFDDKSLRSLEISLGPWGSAGQLQQRPEPKGGGIFRREWWQDWEGQTFPPCEYVVASLDGAYTEKEENDYSALTVWGVFRQDPRNLSAAPKIILMHAWHDRLTINDLVERSAKTCRRFKVDRLLIEAKASGISVAQELRRLYAGDLWSVQLVNPRNLDKTARAYAVQPLFSDGMIYAPDREWADLVKDEMSSFPRGGHDDLVDSATQALRHLRDIGLAVHEVEAKRDFKEAATIRKPEKPLYGAI